MATTGTRTVHQRGRDGLIIHWNRREFSPPADTKLQTGDRVHVGDRLTGELNVERDHFTLMEIWSPT